MLIRYACCVLVAIFAARAAASQKEEIIGLCLDGHLQARAVIRQLRCDVELRVAAFRMVNPYSGKLEDHPAEVQHLSWWEDQDVARCTNRFGGVTEDFLWSGQDQTLKTLEPFGDRRPGKGSRAGRLDGPDIINRIPTAWNYALYYRPEQLRDMLPNKVISATEEVRGRERLCKVVVKNGDSLEDIFFDPQHNFVVSRRVIYPEPTDRTSQFISEVSRFIEVKPGIFFPASVTDRDQYKGKSQPQKTVVFYNVHVNEPIERSKLELRFPPGTQVTDTREGKSYVVGENEEPVGPETPLGKPSELASESFYPTAMQPTTRWAGIALWTAASAAIVVLALYAILRRRTVP